jgi:hypothetical protein
METVAGICEWSKAKHTSKAPGDTAEGFGLEAELSAAVKKIAQAIIDRTNLPTVHFSVQGPLRLHKMELREVDGETDTADTPGDRKILTVGVAVDNILAGLKPVIEEAVKCHLRGDIVYKAGMSAWDIARDMQECDSSEGCQGATRKVRDTAQNTAEGLQMLRRFFKAWDNTPTTALFSEEVESRAVGRLRVDGWFHDARKLLSGDNAEPVCPIDTAEARRDARRDVCKQTVATADCVGRPRKDECPEWTDEAKSILQNLNRFWTEPGCPQEVLNDSITRARMLLSGDTAKEPKRPVIMVGNIAIGHCPKCGVRLDMMHSSDCDDHSSGIPWVPDETYREGMKHFQKLSYRYAREVDEAKGLLKKIIAHLARKSIQLPNALADRARALLGGGVI